MAHLKKGADGHLLKTLAGHLVVECTDDCQTLRDAILERQKAWGITTAWDAGDPANREKQISPAKTDYTIAEYKAYINWIAPKYVDGVYAGGASQPTMLTSSYANSASTCAELLVLVLAMLVVKEGVQLPSSDLWDAYGDDASWATAKTEAEADYSYEDSAANRHGELIAGGGGTYVARIYNYRGKLGISGLDTSISHSATYWGRSIEPGGADQFTFHKQGQSIADEDEWGQLASAAAGTWASHTTDHLFPSSVTWNWPTSGEVDAVWPWGLYYGFEISIEFALVTWDFTHV